MFRSARQRPVTRWAKPTGVIRSHAVFGLMGIRAQLEFVVLPIMEDDVAQGVLSVSPVSLL